jgi:chromosome segregation ATPase
VNLAVLFPILVAIFAPLGAYFLAARKMSGKIKTTDADALWKESSSIREDYRAQLASAAERTRDLESRVARLEGQNNELVQENFKLKHKIQELETLVASLRLTITALESIVQTKDEELKSAK